MADSPEPRWIDQIYADDTGEDFLGLRSVQGNITEYLLPGIITTTYRARYYSFYSWLLHAYATDHPRGMSLARFIKRREQIFALANLVFHEEGGFGAGVARLIGTIKLNRSLGALVDKNRIPLDVDDYVRATNGGYDTYAGVMGALEITRVSEEEGVDVDLLPPSQRLASAFEKAISSTRYFRERSKLDSASSIDRSVLAEYGAKCYLSDLAAGPDRRPVLDVLFGFDAQRILPEPASQSPTLGNMTPSLGLMLDMLDQTKQPFDDRAFRRYIMYGSCPDFKEYRPNPLLLPALSHWKMFQLREYYTFAIYGLWIFFLQRLRADGPISFDHFLNALDGLDISAISTLLKLEKTTLSKLSLRNVVEAILERSDLGGKDSAEAWASFAGHYDVITNEEKIYDRLLDDEQSPEEKLLLSLLMLLTIYLRLKGISGAEASGSEYWAQAGGARRRAMSIFARQIDEYVLEEQSLLSTLEWLFRDYVIAQHTITALQKWQQRLVNTFHFSNDNGLYEWIKSDGNTFTASRFEQAFSMIIDLALVEFDENGTPNLTKEGRVTLNRVLQKLNA